MRSQWSATSKQWSYFKALTGESLPSGCTKSKASALIKKALAGEYVKTKAKVHVHGYRLYSPGHRDHGVVKFEITKNYLPTSTSFETFSQAEAYAQAHFANEEIILEPNTVREIYVD